MSNTIEYINILAIIIFPRRQGGSIAEHYIAIVVVVVVYIGDRETNTVGWIKRIRLLCDSKTIRAAFWYHQAIEEI